ncbi:MAG: hypothetical protein DMG41_07475 [Acidobacteria bacterium]|nr:MAG: hypothetical protein AUH13_10365 [Acidobacteria bacterium 13_2_20CM_58_27]PYT89702.1 MAG: hypothetical protein DMG41_07475 [Acidobacteriota bacterium]
MIANVRTGILETPRQLRDSSLAALALLLASIGLYGPMSYGVTRRTRGIGVRVALGAQQRSVRWLILRETLALTLFGIAIGIPSSLAASRVIASMLFGLSPSDLSIIMTACLLLLAVAFFAGYLPARIASSIDPIRPPHGIKTRVASCPVPYPFSSH